MEEIFKVAGAIIGAVGSSSLIIVGLSSWLGKIWANRIFENERIKNEESLMKIRNEFDERLIEFNSSMERLNNDYNIKMTSLHSERITIIKELYIKLVDLQDYINLFVDDIVNDNFRKKKPESSLNYEKLLEAMPEFMNYTNSNRIFFSKEIVKYIKEIEAMAMMILNFNRKKLFENKWDEDGSDKLNSIMQDMKKNEIPKFRDLLEAEFRSILGVTE